MPTKDPQAVLDYATDWSAWLQEGEAISSATVTTTGDLVVNPSPHAMAIEAGVVTYWLSGGSLGLHAVTCHVITSMGRQDDRTLTITVRER